MKSTATKPLREQWNRGKGVSSRPAADDVAADLSSPSNDPSAINFCATCKMSFVKSSNAYLEHMWSLVHHIRLEQCPGPVCHACEMCRFTCGSLADYSKHIDGAEHQMMRRLFRQGRISADGRSLGAGQPRPDGRPPLLDVPPSTSIPHPWSVFPSDFSFPPPPPMPPLHHLLVPPQAAMSAPTATTSTTAILQAALSSTKPNANRSKSGMKLKQKMKQQAYSSEKTVRDGDSGRRKSTGRMKVERRQLKTTATVGSSKKSVRVAKADSTTPSSKKNRLTSVKNATTSTKKRLLVQDDKRKKLTTTSTKATTSAVEIDRKSKWERLLRKAGGGGFLGGSRSQKMLTQRLSKYKLGEHQTMQHQPNNAGLSVGPSSDTAPRPVSLTNETEKYNRTSPTEVARQRLERSLALLHHQSPVAASSLAKKSLKSITSIRRNRPAANGNRQTVTNTAGHPGNSATASLEDELQTLVATQQSTSALESAHAAVSSSPMEIDVKQVASTDLHASKCQQVIVNTDNEDIVPNVAKPTLTDDSSTVASSSVAAIELKVDSDPPSTAQENQESHTDHRHSYLERLWELCKEEEKLGCDSRAIDAEMEVLYKQAHELHTKKLQFHERLCQIVVEKNNLLKTEQSQPAVINNTDNSAPDVPSSPIAPLDVAPPPVDGNSMQASAVQPDTEVGVRYMGSVSIDLTSVKVEKVLRSEFNC